ncbi:hypothetical protein TSOC111612_23770 [Tsukamurella ocularis]
MRGDDVPDNIAIDSEVLMHQDVPETPDLRPGNLRTCACDVGREVVYGFSDDLEIALDGILRHVGEIVCSAVENRDEALAALDRPQYVRDALPHFSAHRATASARAEAETGRLSS